MAYRMPHSIPLAPMMIVFEINRQRERIEYIRERAKAAFSHHKVSVEEDYTNGTCYVTVTVDPNPPFYGDFRSSCCLWE